MKKICWLLVLITIICLSTVAQTNPTPQSLPFSENFSSLLAASTTYPFGWQGWTVSTTPGGSFNTASPTADRVLTALGTAASATGNVYNYDGKIGFLNTGSLDLSIVLALNTTGQAGIQVNYDIMTIRNPYDGSANTRINEVTLQYRIGTSGTFTTLTGIEYQNNTTSQTTGTTPQNPQSKSIILPAACNNQSVVQIRWISRQVSGAGSRPSFAIDNINVGGGASTLSVSVGADAAEPATNGSFSFTFSTATASSTTFDYALSGTASFSTDYTITLSTGSPSPLTNSNGTITVPAGITAITATVIPMDDNVSEGVKTIRVDISNPSGGYSLGISNATIDLIDDDISPISLTSGVYSQDFNTLVNSGAGSLFALPSGWIFSESGTGANTSYTANSGGSTSGDTYSFGTGTNTDRAFGTLQTNAFVSTIGASLVNNTGATITALAISYTGEQWRFGATGRSDFLNFQYSTDATNLTTGTWTDVHQLDFASPNTTTVGALDGNFSTNRTAVSFVLTGLSIPSGSTFFIRWVDPNVSGADDGLGIDDFSIEANPADAEPPVISSLFPANNAVNTATNLTASIAFNETVQKGTGNIIIKKMSDNSVVQTIDITTAAVTVSATTASFTLSGLTTSTSYYIEIDNGAFKDQSNNDFAGISGNSTWSFTTGIIFYTADFQNCSSSLSDGFTQYSVAGSIVWTCTTFGRDANNLPLGSAPNGVQINGFSGGTNVPNIDWLISPSFNLTETIYPLLSFWSRTAFNGSPLQLKVSTDYVGGDPTLATWTDLNGKFPAQTSNVWTISSEINLSAFKQSNVHVAFVYTSTVDDGARWTVDDISIANSPVPPPPSLTVGTTDIQFNYVANGSTAIKTFTFIGNDLTDNVTLNSTGAFSISKDGTNFSSSLEYTVEEANNITETVYVRFTPTQANQNFAGAISISTSAILANINLKGTSIDPETTLEVVNWNLEWFGSTDPSLGPTNDNLQEQNVKTILQNIGADIYGLVEVVDESRLASIVSQMPGYTYVICNYGSHVNPFETDPSPLSEAQKEAFVFKTSVFSNITTTPLVTNGVNTAADLTNPAYNYFSSGRYPFMMTADVTLNGVTKTVRFVLLHAKANTSPTATSYARRKAGADTLKYTLNTLYPNDNILILGDFNDDLDSTITDGIHPRITSYYAFTNDTVTTFSSPTLALSLAGKRSTVGFNDVIDHVMLSNELNPYYMSSTANVLTDVASLVSNYGSTTSDHYPVFTRYMFCKLNCPENITVSNDAGQCGAIVNFDVSSTMTCGTVTAAPASGSFFPIGSTQVQVTASTGETCSFTITVVDNENPTISCVANQTRNTNANVCTYTVVDNEFDATANDNCTGITIINDYNNSNTLAGAVFNKGQTTVTWTATDAAGNTTNCSFMITVEDHQAPVITAPANITVNTDVGTCYATNVLLGTAITSDNCPGEAASNNAPSQFSKGITTVIWTVTDASGNTNTANQTVIVTDNEKPAITSCPVVPVFCYNAGNNYTIPALTATDNCGSVSYSYNITGATTRSGNTNNATGTFNIGVSTITWVVTDESNNTSTCQTTVTINSPVSSSIADKYAVNPGGAANTIYIGYGPTSLTLDAIVTGGTSPYSYKWTIGSSAGPALNTSLSYTASPTTTTTYYFNAKDVYGCSALLVTKTIYVQDVRCGNKQDKVTVCQLIKSKFTTSCIASKDVSSALANGAYLGDCVNSMTRSNSSPEVSPTALTVTAMPNPSANYFTIHIKGENTPEKLSIRVMDVLGRTIEQKQNLQANSSIKIGSNYYPGIYIVEVVQGTIRQQIKLIKAGN